MTLETLALTAADDHRLAATLHLPATAPVAAAVIAGAMGVPARFYADYAAALAAAGMAALRFDYRGIGASAPARLRGFRASARDWGERDLAAAIATMRARLPDVPLVLVGHSFGGQVLGLAAGAEQARALLLVAAQSGHWRHWQGLGRIGLWSLWHLGIPLLTPVFGRFPMRRLGAGEDLPAGVAEEWARWGRQRDYLFAPRLGLDLDGYARLQAPLRARSFADDGFAPRAAVAALIERYHGVRRAEHIDWRPEAAGAAAIGHFGYFRRPAATLWAADIDWMRAQIA